MRLAIDLHNVRDGGGPNYIRNLLLAADPLRDRLSEVHLFGAPAVLAAQPQRPFIVHHPLPQLEAGLTARLAFVATRLPDLMRKAGAQLLYAPGGIALGNVRPYVTISRNMMPFTPQAWGGYPRLGRDRIRLALLRRLNAATFARADGMIFLTRTARRAILPHMRRVPRRLAVIAHGVDHERFAPLPRRLPPGAGRLWPARIVYPSRLEPYKHQLEVIAAFRDHLGDHPLLSLDLFGPANPAYRARVEAELAALPEGWRGRICYHGEVPHAALPGLYREAALLVFASACENLPNILIEAMASGIPIVCSEASPMPEVVGGAALRFDPRRPERIAAAIRLALADPEATLARAALGVERAAGFSWGRCARATFAFIHATLADHQTHQHARRG